MSAPVELDIPGFGKQKFESEEVADEFIAQPEVQAKIQAAIKQPNQEQLKAQIDAMLNPRGLSPIAKQLPQQSRLQDLVGSQSEINQGANNTASLVGLNTMLMGQGPRTSAAIDALLGNKGSVFDQGIGDRYESNLANQNSNLNYAVKQNPGAAIAGGVVGGMVGPGKFSKWYLDMPAQSMRGYLGATPTDQVTPTGLAVSGGLGLGLGILGKAGEKLLGKIAPNWLVDKVFKRAAPDSTLEDRQGLGEYVLNKFKTAQTLDDVKAGLDPAFQETNKKTAQLLGNYAERNIPTPQGMTPGRIREMAKEFANGADDDTANFLNSIIKNNTRTIYDQNPLTGETVMRPQINPKLQLTAQEADRLVDITQQMAKYTAKGEAGKAIFSKSANKWAHELDQNLRGALSPDDLPSYEALNLDKQYLTKVSKSLGDMGASNVGPARVNPSAVANEVAAKGFKFGNARLLEKMFGGQHTLLDFLGRLGGTTLGVGEVLGNQQKAE